LKIDQIGKAAAYPCNSLKDSGLGLRTFFGVFHSRE